MRENLEFDAEFLEDFEPDWRYMSWHANKVGFIKGAREIDGTCQADLAEGQVYHSMMAQAIESQCSAQAHATSLDYNFVELND